jgi:homopolymeric O-antigen transport system permease protein
MTTTALSSVEAEGDVVEKSDGERGTLGELWQYRELFFYLAWRDVVVRYKQTVLGVAWAVLQPFLTMVVFTLVFGEMANMPSDGLPRPIFYYCGLLPWIYFSSSLTNAGMSLVSNSGLLTKIYFPRLVLPASAVLSGLVDFAIASLLLIGLMVYYECPLRWSLLLWPVLVVALGLLALGIGSFLAAVNVRYRDIKYAIPFGIQLWMFMTPIIYPSSIFPERFQWVLALNPLTGLIDAFRYAVVPTGPLQLDILWVSLGVTALAFVLGVIYFKRAEKSFADIV